MIDPRKSDYKDRLSKYRRFDPVIFEGNAEKNAKLQYAPRKTTSTGLSEYGGEWGEKQAAHLLKRTLFGIRQAELDTFTALSLSESVDQLISPSTLPAPPVNNYFDFVDGEYEPEDPPDAAPGETWVNEPYIELVSFLRNMSLKGWWIKNILSQEASVHQRLSLFWHGLLPTQFFDAGFPGMSYQYFKMLYENAFGNYKTLIKELTLNPAMLYFLNGALNVKGAPDENYSRELQELFTIGKGPNAGFTENDVYEAARVLTGWTIDADSVLVVGDPAPVFVEENHDIEDKQFSAFYGSRTIQGKSGAEGATETDELIDMIFDNEETALYICRRIYNFFVYHEVDNNTEANVIVPLAQIFRDNNYDITPVLKTLFKSEHFFDEVNIGAYIKSPADHVLGLARTLDFEMPEDLTDDFLFSEEIYWLMAIIGMEFGDPPNVSGWQAYYQLPSFDKIWITTDTVTKRAQIQDYIVYDLSDIPKFVATLKNPTDPDLLIKEIALLLHGIELDQKVIDGLRDNLLTGQGKNYWSSAWNQYINEPENEEYRSIVENRLKGMFVPLLQLSEFQLF